MLNITPETANIFLSIPRFFWRGKSFTRPRRNYRDAKLEASGRSFIRMTRRWNCASHGLNYHVGLGDVGVEKKNVDPS
jgi:hypothetical protein